MPQPFRLCHICFEKQAKNATPHLLLLRISAKSDSAQLSINGKTILIELSITGKTAPDCQRRSQPMPQPDPIADRIAEIAAAHAGLEGPLLPILHAVQDAFGHIPEAAYSTLAAALNISRAEVHGVVSFYHDYRTAPAGKNVVKLCRAEACQAMGGDRIAAHAKAALSVDFHQTTADGKVTLEPVFCLGLCACAPAAMVNGKLIGRLDEARVDSIVAECRA
jgi:formate dehydrogenase subunit gamma